MRAYHEDDYYLVEKLDPRSQKAVGIFISSQGEKYSGFIENGLMTDLGILEFANGDIYTGEFSEGLMNGFGEYRYSNGDLFKGYFKNGLRSGLGRLLKISEGMDYVGYWEHNTINGDGFLFKGESVEKCRHENGILLMKHLVSKNVE